VQWVPPDGDADAPDPTGSGGGGPVFRVAFPATFGNSVTLCRRNVPRYLSCRHPDDTYVG